MAICEHVFSVMDDLQRILNHRYIPGLKRGLVEIFRSNNEFFFSLFFSVVLLLPNSLLHVFQHATKRKKDGRERTWIMAYFVIKLWILANL